MSFRRTAYRTNLFSAPLLALVLASAGRAQEAWDPPKPDPANPVDYIAWVDKTLGAGLDERDNAAKRYLDCFKRLTDFEGEWDEFTTKPWADDAKMSKWLDENRLALTLFRSASKKDDCYFALDGDYSALFPDPQQKVNGRAGRILLAAKLPYLAKYRVAARGIIAEAMRALANNKEEEFTENLTAVLRAAHHLGQRNAFAIRHLVAISLLDFGYRSANAALKANALSLEFLAQLAEEIDRSDPELPSIATASRSDRLSALDIVQRLFVQAPSGGWTADPAVLREFAAVVETDANELEQLLEPVIQAGYDKSSDDVQRSNAAAEQWWSLSYKHAMVRMPEFMDTIKAEPDQNRLTAVMAFASEKALGTDTRYRATRRATHLILHLHAYKAKHGDFPDALDALTVPDLAKLRIDPFRDEDFVYRRQGDGFLLYSVAGNMTDDGGSHSAKEWREKGDLVFWPVQE